MHSRIKKEYNSDEDDDDEEEDDDDFDGSGSSARRRYGSSSNNSYRRKFRNKLTRDEWRGDDLIKCTKCDKVRWWSLVKHFSEKWRRI